MEIFSLRQASAERNDRLQVTDQLREKAEPIILVVETELNASKARDGGALSGGALNKGGAVSAGNNIPSADSSLPVSAAGVPGGNPRRAKSLDALKVNLDGAKFRCPECSKPFKTWKRCSKHFNSTGHAEGYDTLKKMKTWIRSHDAGSAGLVELGLEVERSRNTAAPVPPARPEIGEKPVTSMTVMKKEESLETHHQKEKVVPSAKHQVEDSGADAPLASKGKVPAHKQEKREASAAWPLSALPLTAREDSSSDSRLTSRPLHRLRPAPHPWKTTSGTWRKKTSKETDTHESQTHVSFWEKKLGIY
jgi:uncharacterized C2H2 Zn-finger protein